MNNLKNKLNHFKLIAILLLVLLSFSCASISQYNFYPTWMKTKNIAENVPGYRWHLNEDGGITWNVLEKNYLPHYDHIEMAGFNAAVLASYGVKEDCELLLHRRLIVPQLRTLPNDTHASFAHNTNQKVIPQILVNGKQIDKYFVEEISIQGNLVIDCTTDSPLKVKRSLYPAVNQKALVEQWDLFNPSKQSLELNISDPDYLYLSPKSRGLTGSYKVISKTLLDNQGLTKSKPGITALNPNETKTIYFVLLADEKDKAEITFDPSKEIEKREDFKNELWDKLVLTTPDPIIDRAFQFSKLRASESIFETKNGLMHGPGGASYYAALWTNDQCEYANPFFAYTGYDKAIEQSVNCYVLYSEYMKEDFSPMVVSIIAEGFDTWSCGYGDRGDAAMYAYGASRFALTNADKDVALELWPFIQWSLEYSKRRKNSSGVIESESDELEGRFPTGMANLCTNSLYYDALVSASYLAEELDFTEYAKKYKDEAFEMKDTIEAYFGANMSGFETYRYFKENKVLRSWIAIPLTMGIFDRAKATTDALFSDYLWFGNGMLTQAGEKTFWDRSTLYAFRGTIFAGEVDRTFPYLEEYTKNRLIGEHVPYSIEAWPEGNQKHLSAESALYCRIFTEGLFGIRPTGFNCFTILPRLPQHWDFASLSNIHAYGSVFDINLKRIDKDRLSVRLIDENGSSIYEDEIIMGETIEINL